MGKKTALITGITGQDGSYLAEYLLGMGYRVHGMVRRESLEDPARSLTNINHILDKIVLHEGSLESHLTIYKVFRQVMPDECYHLAAASFVNYSFDDEYLLMNRSFNTTYYLLSVIKELRRDCRMFFAGSSEMFGDPESSPQNENTPFNPKSIHGISKVACCHLMRYYREKEGLYACTGIMYNHESPRRGYQFVTRKITSAVARIVSGIEKKVVLGNLEAKRDWGYAPDYVKAMWLMLQGDKAEDYIMATGRLLSVRDFLEAAFSHAGLDYRDYVQTDQRLFRASEVHPLCGNPEKIARALGWSCTKTFAEIAGEMVDNDIRSLDRIEAGKQ